MDPDENFCFGPDANMTCHREDVKARLVKKILCPHELTEWRDGAAPVFNCRDIHPNTVKPANLDVALRDPLKVFLVRFYDSGKESSRTHKMWNRLVEKIDRKQVYNYIIPYQVNCDSDEATRRYCQHEQGLQQFPDVVAIKNAKEIELNEVKFLSFFEFLFYFFFTFVHFFIFLHFFFIIFPFFHYFIIFIIFHFLILF